MRMPHQQPDNEGVLRYLGQGIEPARVSAGPPPDDVDRWRLGAHPDVVARLWDQLNARLPTDGRFLVAGGPALVDTASGLIVTAGLGTQYALRLRGSALAAALAAGHETSHTFRTVDRTLDLAATFGPDWVFGRWDDREADWLSASVRALSVGA